MKLTTIMLAAALTISQTTQASDHIDGKVTSRDSQADLTDLYVYPTPNTPRSLTIALNSYPFVSSTGHFSEKIDFNFIIRKASITPEGTKFATDEKSEVVINCKFKTPAGSNSGIQMVCQSTDANHRIMGQIGFNEIATTPKTGNNILLFAGRRNDPFFLSAGYFKGFTGFKKVKPDGDNVMSRLNCLSVVMTIGIDQLFPQSNGAMNTPKTAGRKVAQADSYLIAVAAEAVTYDNGTPRRLDRVGRPEITNISLNMTSNPVGPDGVDIRDRYNRDAPFAVPAANAKQYADRLNQMIKKYDTFDGVQDWTDEKLNQLTSILVEDYQVVDLFMPNCQKTHYFEIEKSLLQGQPHKTCGGRDPNDSIANKLYTIYEHGPNYGGEIADDTNDGVNSHYFPISQNFPYLADPDNSFLAGLKRLAALALGGG